MSRYLHKGIREFNAEEISAANFGQIGFKILTGGGNVIGTDYFCKDHPLYTGAVGQSLLSDIVLFTSVKAIQDDAIVKLDTLKGSPFTDGAWGGLPGPSTAITILNSDIVHGTFDRIWVAQNDIVLAYIGKKQ